MKTYSTLLIVERCNGILRCSCSIHNNNTDIYVLASYLQLIEDDILHSMCFLIFVHFTLCLFLFRDFDYLRYKCLFNGIGHPSLCLIDHMAVNIRSGGYIRMAFLTLSDFEDAILKRNKVTASSSFCT